MSKHTPGPWEILRYCNVRDNDPDAVGVGSDMGIVADVWKDGVMEEAGDANAKLIAAAPELLKMLEIAGAYVKEMGSEHSWPSAIEEDYRNIRAAIAKAEGRP